AGLRDGRDDSHHLGRGRRPATRPRPRPARRARAARPARRGRPCAPRPLRARTHVGGRLRPGAAGTRAPRQLDRIDLAIAAQSALPPAPAPTGPAATVETAEPGWNRSAAPHAAERRRASFYVRIDPIAQLARRPR